MPIETLDIGFAHCAEGGPNEVRFRRKNHDVSDTDIEYIRYFYTDVDNENTYNTGYSSVGEDGKTYAVTISDNIYPGTSYRYEVYGYDSSGDWTGDSGGLIYWDTPTAEIVETTNIEHDSFTLNGDVDPGWYGDIWYRWSYNDNWTGWSYASYARSVSQNVTWNVEPDTSYSATLYIYESDSADDEVGYSYTDYFTTPSEPEKEDPVAETRSAINISDSSARMRGEVDDMGDWDEVRCWIRWWESGEDTTNDEYIETASDAPEYYHYNASGLSSGTTYWYKAILTDSDSIILDEGSEVSFTTYEEPTVETRSATSVDYESATLRGEVTDMGTADSVEERFRWRKSGDSWSYYHGGNIDDVGYFSHNISGLDENTEYEFQAGVYCDDTYTHYGDSLSFTTQKEDPYATTDEVDNIQTDSATFYATIHDMGDYDDLYGGFQWRKTGDDTWIARQGDKYSTAQSYDETITTLESDTEYEFRVRLENIDETKRWVGEAIDFTTKKQDPSVSTEEASNIKETEATLNGEITDMGDWNTVYYYFEWGKTGDENTTTLTSTSTTGNKDYQVTNLDPETEYWFTFYVEDENENILASGDSYSFTTEKDIVYPVKYWDGSSWVEVDRDKLKFYVDGSWQGEQFIKGYIDGTWKEV